jgi:tRNA pseudouridine55 synthase
MVNGLLPVDKPSGPSSSALVEHVRRLTRARRVGHAGTLDPGANGILVLAFGRATALFPYLPTEKSYRAVVRLGAVTDTQDAQGRILDEREVPSFSPETIIAALQHFTGTIQQKPPMVSALHHNGERLYKIALRGETVDLPFRTVTLSRIFFLHYHAPDITFDVDCSRGTYIRSLASDLGEQLGCGGHLLALTRTACSGFTQEQAVSLETLEQLCRAQAWTEKLTTPAEALRHFPAVTVDGKSLTAVQHGHSLPAPVGVAGGWVRVLDPAGALLAIAEVRGADLVMKRVLVGE